MTARDLKLDYFKVYDVEDRPATGALQLRGQFDRRPMRMDLVLLDFFLNAVSKNGEPLYDKSAHLTWYRGRQVAEPNRRVLLENQLGRQTVYIGNGIGLLVPTHKVERGMVFPEGLDHYKLYRVLDFGNVPNVVVKLKDQWGSDEARLRAPIVLGVPVIKRHGTKTYPIRNERAHLLIFDMTPRSIQRTVRLRNQIRSEPVKVLRSAMLAVPSLKREWRQVSAASGGR